MKLCICEKYFKSSWSQTVLANQNCENFDLS